MEWAFRYGRSPLCSDLVWSSGGDQPRRADVPGVQGCGVRCGPLVHTDDYGMRVDGGPAFLMAFETDEVYQVRALVREVVTMEG